MSPATHVAPILSPERRHEIASSCTVRGCRYGVVYRSGVHGSCPACSLAIAMEETRVLRGHRDDLLAAAEEVLDYLREIGEGPGPDMPITNALASAIARATGETT